MTGAPRSLNRSRRRKASAALAGSLLFAAVPAATAIPAAADAGSIVVSEVWSSGSSNAPYAADWFELTNTGATPVDISGWKFDDGSNAFASAVPLAGAGVIEAGQSVVFVEGDATKVALLKAAWFGTEVPPGLAVGTYTGSGIGLSSSGDAVNIFDGAGTPVTGVTFGPAGLSTTFDNTTGAVGAISTLSVVGTNGAFVSFDGAETGSPGTIATVSGPTTIDLSTYVRVGRHDLPEPTRTAPPDGTSLLAQEVSAVTYNPVTDSLFVVGDGGTSIVQVSKTGVLIDSMTLAPGSSPQGTEFYDPEGLAYVGGGNRFVLTEERDRQVVEFTYSPGTTLTRGAAQTVKLGTFVDNTGLEGLSNDPLTGGLIPVKEISPMGVFQTDVDFAAGTASNGSPTTVNSVDLFDPTLTGLSDIADVFALSNLPSMAGEQQEENLLILSQEDGRIVNVDRSGNVSSTLTIVSDPGNPLSVPNQQHEGLTMDEDGTLYVVNENGGGSIDHPQLWVYEPSAVPNQPPSAVTLSNPVTSLLENTSTATRLKIADVVVTDDGLGTNNLTVVGADAASFEVDSNGLYLAAGTMLDFEVATSYSVAVAVDDPTVGSTPDATSTTLVLDVTDVVDETGDSYSLVISEVSPWSSGGTSYGADWFEVTNLGGEAVDITNWKVDDGSNSYALSVALTGVSAIAPGQSVVFAEGNAATANAFRTSWFGGSEPVGFTIGTYSGGGMGLSTGGDAVNLFDQAGNRVTGVAFGISTSGQTFDNTIGVGSNVLPLPEVSTLSVVPANGAFLSADGIQVGSPGSKATTLIVSEISPWSSGGSPYGADWFEVTNTGAATVSISGWKMDDNSNSPVGAVPLVGATSIAPGRSAIFVEGGAGPAAPFVPAWFGSTPPVDLVVGSYTGSGVGLSTGGDAVNLFDAAGRRVTGVNFGASTTGYTFDNAAGIAGAVSTLSVAGVTGAFLAADGIETGSPGEIVNLPVPVVLPGATSVVEGDAGTIAALVPVTLSVASKRAVTVSWTTLEAPGSPAGQATPGVDYGPNVGTVTFAPGELTATVSVSVNGDSRVEVDEFVLVGFSGATNATVGGIWGLGGTYITNDDATTVTPGATSAVEGNVGLTEVLVPVTLTNPSDLPVTVNWTTVQAPGEIAGQAMPGDDYLTASGTVTFAPGETVAYVSVYLVGDTTLEVDEFVLVAFSNAVNATVGGFLGLGGTYITNDD